jgi:hypothetical protein
MKIEACDVKSGTKLLDIVSRHQLVAWANEAPVTADNVSFELGRIDELTIGHAYELVCELSVPAQRAHYAQCKHTVGEALHI